MQHGDGAGQDGEQGRCRRFRDVRQRNLDMVKKEVRPDVWGESSKNASVDVDDSATEEKVVFVKFKTPPSALSWDAKEPPASQAPSVTAAFTNESDGLFAAAQKETSYVASPNRRERLVD